MKNQPTFNYQEFLTEILEKPATANNCFRLFRNYSILNQWVACMQMSNPEPINTYKGWQSLGRQVKKGAKAIALRMPVTVAEKDENGNKTDELNTFFIFKNNWFKLSDTTGEEFKPVEVPNNFNLDKALEALEIKQEPFQEVNGNCQGYAISHKKIIAINPLCKDKFKVILHEVAHCLLHNKDEQVVAMHGEQLPTSLKEFEAEATAYLVLVTLGIYEGLEYSRHYIKNWLNRAGGHELKEQNFKRVLNAVNKIITAGTK